MPFNIITGLLSSPIDVAEDQMVELLHCFGDWFHGFAASPIDEDILRRTAVALTQVDLRCRWSESHAFPVIITLHRGS